MAKREAKRPNIYDHHDPVEFLKDWLDYLKASRKGFSLRQLAKDSGFATGYLPMILSRKRNLSDKAFEKMAPHLGLPRNEMQVFKHLRVIAETENPEERLQALANIQRHQAYKETNNKEVEVYKYLTKWYYVTIREMCLLEDFQEDPTWIQERLNGRVSLAEVKQALAFLFENGYLERDAKGRARVTEKMLDCKEGVFKISLGQFHRQMLQLAGESIDNTPRSERYLLGHTAAIRAQDLDKVRGILDEALAKIEKLAAEAEKTDAVYHIELAAFPTAKSREKDEDGGSK